MRKCIPLVVIALHILLSSCSQNPGSDEGKPLQYQKVLYTGNKPTAPFDTDIQFVTPPVAGQIVTLIFSAKPQIQAKDAELNIAIPDGIVLYSGSCNWKGPLTKDEEKKLSIECIIPDDMKRTIVATATLKDGTAKLTKVCSITVGTIDNSNKPKGTIRKDEKGETIREFKIEK